MNRRIAIAAAALALALGAMPLMAQAPVARSGGAEQGGPGRGRGPGFGPMGILPGLNQVGLTDAQREQVRAVMEQERQTANAGQGLRQAEAALHGAVLADAPDPQAIESAKAALASAQMAELNHRVELMQKIAQILSPAQRQQLAQLQRPAGGRRGGAPGL